MILTFGVFTLFFLPTMLNYKSGSAYDDSPSVGYAKGMISNLGFSSVHCLNTPVSIGKIELACSYGTIGNVLDYGVNNPSSGSPPDACVNNQ